MASAAPPATGFSAARRSRPTPSAFRAGLVVAPVVPVIPVLPAIAPVRPAIAPIAPGTEEESAVPPREHRFALALLSRRLAGGNLGNRIADSSKSLRHLRLGSGRSIRLLMSSRRCCRGQYHGRTNRSRGKQ